VPPVRRPFRIQTVGSFVRRSRFFSTPIAPS